MLIVDDDLGFVFWLGHTLDNLGHCALPAKTVQDAALLIMQFDLQIDVLVIDVALPGASDFTAAIHRTNSRVKVIGIVDDQSPARIPGVSVAHPKPACIDASARFDWIDCVEGVLADRTVPRPVARTSTNC